MTSFSEFDPLESKSANKNEAALNALKREIKNILSSYVGWYDPFAELIQNALDSLEARAQEEQLSGNLPFYRPEISITVDLQNNSLTVTDNGIGLNSDQFQQFLAPNFSFKSEKTNRGHKGVGATYIAYGFNHMQIATRAHSFEAIGCIRNARKWLNDPSPSGNPKVTPDSSNAFDSDFTNLDRGASITVKFDETTHPKKLDWIQAKSAESWWKILSIKTGLGAIFANDKITVKIKVVDSKGIQDQITKTGIRYYWIHNDCNKKATFNEIKAIEKKLFEKNGGAFKHPDKINNLDIIYETWDTTQLLDLLGKNLDSEERQIIDDHKPVVSVEFGYTAKLWQKFNEGLGIRANQRVLHSGIQMAANGMPQGETIQIPLNRNTGRQNQIHFLFHFDNYSPDLGRKGFHRELSDFAKNIARKITEGQLTNVKARLKANTGNAPDLKRELEIDEWKSAMLGHEEDNPLEITSPHFFLPTQKISITSIPTREQDVIALFNQIIAGGIIRGIRVMSTNERFTYDGLFKISFDLPIDKYTFHEDTNPLGIDDSVATELVGITSKPKILEYKYSLDGLVEDIDSGDKNLKDINLAVVWETGKLYVERFGITSLLLSENRDQREYHGLTHALCDIESGSKVMDLIVLKELITYLNDPSESRAEQLKKYE
ncbi:hypothetical protein [Undibacterium curvum]|uniref:hypothetical protein n=1 Tax=Undibacterium curvum TaxID=2762294 RepID=UPI003D112001